MTIRQNNSKINNSHLERKAVVYLRQSTERQVQYNIESQRLQYALVEQAENLGWQKIEIIDSDLGASAGIGARERVGFDRLIAMVAKGEVGIILSREVSRLSRTDKDWCRLMEVCQIFDTLISDEEQVYNLSEQGDQLVFGIKGVLSTVELKTIQMRMFAAKDAKARRGELYGLLPPGYVMDAVGKIVKDNDLRIQEAINLIFQKFRELWSIRKTFFWFCEQGIELPIHSCHGVGRKITWKRPTHSFIGYVLGSAFYAGAYVWGRQVIYKTFEDGKVKKHSKRVYKEEDYKVFIADHHEGYIDWNTFKENEKIIKGNKIMSSINDLPGAIRSGRGILAGLLRCGYCGRKITIFYNAKKSSYPSYSCTGNNNARKRSCFGFGGRKVEKRFSQEILKVLSPLGINASLIAIDELKSGDNEKRKALERQYEQIEYEAKRAFEQYNAVDARNRLVAEELEHRWNEKLEHLKKVKLSLATLEQQNTLSEEERQRILQLGENFQQVWESEYCSVETKKKIIRILVETVIIKLNDSGDKLHIVIHWKGGTHTQFDMERPLDATKQKTSLEAIEIIRKMGSRYGYSDIAQALNKAGHQTGKGNSWTEARVEAMRYKYSIPGQTKTKPNADILTLNQAAKYCNVSKTTIKNLVSKGVLKNKQSSPYAPWEINRFDLDSDLVRTIIARLRKTGKLIIQGDDLSVDQLLFE